MISRLGPFWRLVSSHLLSFHGPCSVRDCTFVPDLQAPYYRVCWPSSVGCPWASTLNFGVKQHATDLVMSPTSTRRLSLESSIRIGEHHFGMRAAVCCDVGASLQDDILYDTMCVMFTLIPSHRSGGCTSTGRSRVDGDEVGTL